LGTNDGGGRLYDEEKFQAYRQGMQTLIQRIESIGAKPVLMTPPMFDGHAAARRSSPVDPQRLEFFNSTLAYYGAWLRQRALADNLDFVDLYSPLSQLTVERRRTDPEFTLIRLTQAEEVEIGRIMAGKLNGADGPVMVMVPLV
jgi:hypothetical protein